MPKPKPTTAVEIRDADGAAEITSKAGIAALDLLADILADNDSAEHVTLQFFDRNGNLTRSPLYIARS